MTGQHLSLLCRCMLWNKKKNGGGGGGSKKNKKQRPVNLCKACLCLEYLGKGLHIVWFLKGQKIGEFEMQI